MWILSLLPSAFLGFIVNGVLLLGVVGVVFSFVSKSLDYVPALAVHRTLIQVASILVLTLGVYLKGAYNTEMYWRDKVEEAEAKVKVAEEKAAATSAQIEYKYIDKIKVVKDVQVVIQEKIVEKEKLIDAECKVAPVAIDILNESAKFPGGKK